MVSLKNDLLWVKCSIYETVKICKFRICGLSLPHLLFLEHLVLKSAYMRFLETYNAPSIFAEFCQKVFFENCGGQYQSH